MGTSVYPGALDDFAEASPPYLADDDTTGRDHPARHDDMEAAMEAVQGELGTDPAGGSATVKARLDAADSTVASKAPLDSPAFTGTVNFTGTSVIGLPVAGISASPPSSVANSGGTASLSGNTVTFTGVSSVSLNGCFTGDYDNYRLLAAYVGTQNPTIALKFRARLSGTDESAASYLLHRIYSTDTAGPTRSYAAGGTSFDIGFIGNIGQNVLAMDVIGPKTATWLNATLHSYGGSASDSYGAVGMGALQSTTQYDGFTIFPASGTITGTISVYGYKA